MFLKNVNGCENCFNFKSKFSLLIQWPVCINKNEKCVHAEQILFEMSSSLLSNAFNLNSFHSRQLTKHLFFFFTEYKTKEIKLLLNYIFKIYICGLSFRGLFFFSYGSE